MDDLPKGQLRIAIRMIAILMMYPIIVLMSKLHCVFNLDLYYDLYLKLQVLKPVLPINIWLSPAIALKNPEWFRLFYFSPKSRIIGNAVFNNEQELRQNRILLVI
jgi:hypothetical protein